MATAYCALVFTGLVGLSAVVSFGCQAFHMWKTKNYRFLHKDVFSLLFVGAIFLSVALVSGTRSILFNFDNSNNGGNWICEPIRWTWVGFNSFMSLVCLGLLSLAILNNGKNLSLSAQANSISDIHSYSSTEEESFEDSEEEVEFEGGEIPSNLQGNI